MKTKILPFLMLLFLPLTACTGLTPPPAVINPRLEAPAALTTCAARPPHPCPPPDAKAAPAAPTAQVCNEKARLRWEAMLYNWGADCESKLRSLAAYFNEAAGKIESK